MAEIRWFVHCKTQDVYQFVVQNCQDFDPDTDCIPDALVYTLDSDMKSVPSNRNLMEINWDMKEKLEHSRMFKSGVDYEIYTQKTPNSRIEMSFKMYGFKNKGIQGLNIQRGTKGIKKPH